jgi:two-component system phosphate regulon sensor histidine kinase PhoR
MLGLGFYLASYVRQNHFDDLEKSLTSQAQLISDSIKPYLISQDANQDYINTKANTWANLLGARISIIGSNGVVIGDSHKDPGEMDNHLNRPEVYQALEFGFGTSIRTSATVGYEMMYVAIPVIEDGTITGFTRIALPTDEINRNISQLYRNIFYVSLVGLTLTIALSTLIAHLITRPLIALTNTARQMIDDDQIHPSSPSKGYDEIWQLTNAFNNLVYELRTQITALQTEQGRLSNVLEQMTDGVIITDENSIVMLINPKAESLFNLEKSKPEGNTLIQIVRDHQIFEAWQQCKQSGNEQAITLEIPRENKFIQCIIISLQTDLPEQYLLLFQDLTRMRRLETVRRDFVSNISHELRTPLASVKALTETLQAGAMEDPPTARRFLNKMETEIDALSHMVSELLELTRIESGQVPLKLKSVTASELLNNAVERLSVQAERGEININVFHSDNLPNIIADPPRLGQAIVNLLHNAIKFTPAGGEIRLNAAQKDDKVIFSIEDTGIGIPRDDLSRIFERFYKADRARSGGGTGLGLAITRHLVEAHGGQIWAESIEGEGSTFYFTIPIDY